MKVRKKVQVIYMQLKESQIQALQNQYPPGSRIKCIHLVDLETLIPTGSLGIVEHVDHQGYIQTRWDNGQFISLIPGVDSFMKVGNFYDR